MVRLLFPRYEEKAPMTQLKSSIIWVIHGPNLNLLGKREPHFYGGKTLGDIDELLLLQARVGGFPLCSFQSNHEGVLIDTVHKALDQGVKFIIINPGGLTHTSIALRDAFASVSIPFIEVHLSNIYRREPFRHHSYLSDIAQGVIAGFGYISYQLALSAAMDSLCALEPHGPR